MLMGDPFVGNVPKKISKEELIQALRVDIAGELEAITVYDAHAMATDDPRAKAILTSIRDEERQHVGELIHLIEILDPTEAQLLGKGKQEVVTQLLAQQGQRQPVMNADYMQAGAPVGNQQMQQPPGQSGSMQQPPGQSGSMQMPQSQGQSTTPQGQQGQPGQPGLGQYHNFTYQPRPGNFGHRGPNNW